MNKVDERFENDPIFHMATKAILNLMETTELTPLDIRDAAYLARLIFERTHVRPIIFSERCGLFEEGFVK